MSVKVTWYSHACFLIETDGTQLLTDPFLSGNPMAPVRADEVEADYILVSHGHGDHVGDMWPLPSARGPWPLLTLRSRAGYRPKGWKGPTRCTSEGDGIFPLDGSS